MREAHRLLAGREPWPGVRVERDHLRRQLEHELMGKLVRLRQAYGALWAEPKRLAGVIVGSAPGFFTMLRAVLRLAGKPVPGRPEALVSASAALIGFTAAELAPLIRHAEGGPALRLEGGARDPVVATYLAAVGRTGEDVEGVGVAG